MEVQNTPKAKKQIYKGANPTSILDHEKKNQNEVKRTYTNIVNSYSKNKNKKHTKFTFSDYRISSPKKSLKNVKKYNNLDEFNYEDSLKLNHIISSPHPKYDYNVNHEHFQNNMSPMLHVKKSTESNIQKSEKKDNNKKLKHETKVKKIFYFLTASTYFSLYLLFLKILFNLPITIIPPLGTSLFIISFNNVVLSILFIILDQIDYSEYLSFKRVMNNFPKVIIKFISILFTIKGLERINLITFITLIYMKPIIISFLKLLESNKSHNSMDFLCYFLFCFICISEFLLKNTISIFFSYLLIAIDLLESLTKLKNIRSLHPYFINFGTSIIGFSISPIIMVLNKDKLIFSFSQYLLFLIISFTYFFSIYFLSKYRKYHFGQNFKIFSFSYIYFLFIIYSTLLLRENNDSLIYIFFMVSFFINIYAFFRNDSINL
jgi:hypothetical protein